MSFRKIDECLWLKKTGSACKPDIRDGEVSVKRKGETERLAIHIPDA